MSDLDIKYMDDINYWLGKLSMCHEFLDTYANKTSMKPDYQQLAKERDEIMKHISRLACSVRAI